MISKETIKLILSELIGEKDKMNIVLIGFMGSGKSSIGKILSKRLKMKLVDTDKLIEKKTKKRISEIFKEIGERGFRQIEVEVIDDVSSLDQRVIACGGGAVLNPLNVKNLKKKGILVYLKAIPQVLEKRLEKVTDRPLLEGKNHQLEIIKLLSKREPIYQKVADLIVETSSLSPEEVSEKIIEELKRIGKWRK